MERLLPLLAAGCCLCLASMPSFVGGAAQPNPQLETRVDPEQLAEWCKNFTQGNQEAQEFYSPVYPREYPPQMDCTRTITADMGYFVRIDFRDVFRVEPPSTAGTCDYDYLEIRDGPFGYSPLIGRKDTLN